MFVEIVGGRSFCEDTSHFFIATLVSALVGCHRAVVPSGEAYRKRMDDPSGSPITGNPPIELSL